MPSNEKGAPENSPPCLGGVAASRGRGGSSERIHDIPHLKTFRTKLRKRMTPAEASLWKTLQNSKFEGRKFRRQHSVGSYILDFFCYSERLGIELDGQVHFNERAAEYDYERKLFLNLFGIKILRFENFLVFQEREYVLNRIEGSFGWWKTSKISTTPSAEAADTPPNQGGEF